MGNNDLYTMSDEAFAEANPEALFAEAPSEPLLASDEPTDAPTVEDTPEENMESGSEELEVTGEEYEEQNESEPKDEAQEELFEMENALEEDQEVASGSENDLNYEQMYGELLAP